MSGTILTDETLMSSTDKNEKEKEKEKENGNENDERLMLSKDDDDENENENEDDDETMSQNEKREIIQGKNDILDKIIDKSKSFEEQMINLKNKSLKKLEDLKGFWSYKDFGDKELKFKCFKIELANMSNDIDEKLFEQIFGHTLIKLADKLINATNKEENQIIVKNINKNKEKLYEQNETDPFHDWVIQPSDWRINLIDAIKLILKFNETILLHLV